VSRPYRLTRARYSSRENTPFSMSSSTIAFKAATDLRWVSSTPRSTSTALGRERAGGSGGGLAAAAAGAFTLRDPIPTTARPVPSTVLPALLTIFMLCSSSSRSTSSPRYQREMAWRMALAPASLVSTFLPPVSETR